MGSSWAGTLPQPSCLGTGLCFWDLFRAAKGEILDRASAKRTLESVGEEVTPYNIRLAVAAKHVLATDKSSSVGNIRSIPVLSMS